MRNRIPTGCLRKRGNTYYCQWKYKNAPYAVSLQTTVKSDAENLLKNHMASVVSDILNGNYIAKYGQPVVPAVGADRTPAEQKAGRKPRMTTAPANRDIPLLSAWKTFLNSTNRPDSGESTLEQYAFQWGIFLEWMTENHPAIKTISKVDKFVARQFAFHISSTKGANTFNKYINLLRMVFCSLNDTLDIAVNPWDNIRRKRCQPKGRKPFSKEEVETILSKATGELLTLCLLGSHTGFRLECCCLLKWSEVSLEKRLISHIPWKTKRRRPNHIVHLYILDRLYKHLLVLKNTATSDYICPAMAETYRRNDTQVVNPLQVFFSEKCGIAIHYDEKGSNGRALTMAGFHSFRHYFVTKAKEAGIDSSVVREIVGWGSSEMEKLYNHLSEDHLIEAVKKMEAPKPATPRKTRQKPRPPVLAVSNLTDDELARSCEAMMAELERRRKAS